MAYKKTNWEDAPSTSTPLNATNLNHIEEGIFNNSSDIADINKSLLNCEKVYALGAVTSASSLISYKEKNTIYTGTIAYQAEYSGDFLMFIINSGRYLLTSDGHLWRFNSLATTTSTKLTYTAAEVESLLDDYDEAVTTKINLKADKADVTNQLSKLKEVFDDLSNNIIEKREENVAITEKKYEYSSNGPYYIGFVLTGFFASILPKFIDNTSTTYEYLIAEYPSLNTQETQQVNIIKDWTILNYDEPIPLNIMFEDKAPYKIIFVKSASKIGVANVDSNVDYSGVAILQSIISNGYINFYSKSMAPLCDAVKIKFTEKYLKKEEYSQGNSGWKDCNIGIIGDSFTALGNWAQEMGENLGANIYSKAMSAQSFNNQNGRSAYKQAQMFASENPNIKFDAFVIVMGTNDNDTEVNDITDVNSLNDLPADKISTYTGGMQACVMYLQEHYPNARILLGWTPACGLWSGGTYPEYVKKMNAHISRMKEVAEWYGIEYIETRCCGFTRKNSVYSQYWGDDNHPNALGHHKIAQYMTMLMKSLGGYIEVKTS